jgi:hypothetical protein
MAENSPTFLTCEVAGQACRYRYLRLDGTETPVGARMAAFARKYAARWLRRHGSLPAHDHLFPNPWEPTFLIEFSRGPVPSAGVRA